MRFRRTISLMALLGVLVWTVTRTVRLVEPPSQPVRALEQDTSPSRGGSAPIIQVPSRQAAARTRLPGASGTRDVGITGAVRGPDGAPIAGAVVRLLRVAEVEEVLGSSTTDDTGRFWLAFPGPGYAVLHARAEGWQDEHWSYELGASPTPLTHDFTLSRLTGVPLRITTSDGTRPFEYPWNCRLNVTGSALPAVVESYAAFGPSVGEFLADSQEPRDAELVVWQGRVELSGQSGYVHVSCGTSVLASRLVVRGSAGVVIALPAAAFDQLLASLSLTFQHSAGQQAESVACELSSKLIPGSRSAMRSKGAGTFNYQVKDQAPGPYDLVLWSRERVIYRRKLVLLPGQHLDLGTLRSLMIGGRVAGPGQEDGARAKLVLAPFLPEYGVVAWNQAVAATAGSSGRFRFDGLSPGRYLLRADRDADPLSVANFPWMGSGGIWCDLVDKDETQLLVQLQPLVEVRVAARTPNSRTRSLRIHDASGYELRSEWTGEAASVLHLVAGSYEVAWWDEQAELRRDAFVVGEDPVDLQGLP